MKNTLWLAQALTMAWVASAPAFASDIRSVTPTVQAAGVAIRIDDVLLTDKKTYVHALWDAFPAHQALDDEAKRRGLDVKALRALAVPDLVKALVTPHFPRAALVKVDVVEFPERDVYGSPDWGTITKLEHVEIPLARPTPSTAKRHTKQPATDKDAE